MFGFIRNTFDETQKGQEFTFSYTPLMADHDFSHNDQGLSSYLRFYGLHQQEMDVQLSQLQRQLRHSLTQRHHQLARLASVDEALMRVLSLYSRQQYAAIPRLLKQRFEFLMSEKISNEVRQATFIKEMQQVLLAELDIRLQFSMGLVEAFEINNRRHH